MMNAKMNFERMAAALDKFSWTSDQEQVYSILDRFDAMRSNGSSITTAKRIIIHLRDPIFGPGLTFVLSWLHYHLPASRAAREAHARTY